jgi:hypothetical protein
MRTRTISAVLAGFVATAAILTSTGLQADLRDDMARCSALADDAERLACFDTITANARDERDAAAEAAAVALAREFRFDRGLQTGPMSFRIETSGNLIRSRATAAAREVEAVVRRIDRALGGSDDWRIAVTVHGAKVTLSRGNPYTGAELLTQALAGMARTGLGEDRYTVEVGREAEPVLWDDGRVRSANENIEIDVVGFGNAPDR